MSSSIEKGFKILIGRVGLAPQEKRKKESNDCDEESPVSKPKNNTPTARSLELSNPIASIKNKTKRVDGEQRLDQDVKGKKRHQYSLHITHRQLKGRSPGAVIIGVERGLNSLLAGQKPPFSVALGEQSSIKQSGFLVSAA